MSQEICLLTARDVCERAALSRATLYRLVAAGRFPKPLKVGSQAVRWRADEIAEHIEKLSAARAV